MRTVVAGAGSYGQVYLEYLLADGELEIVGFVDDDAEKVGMTCRGLPVLGTTSQMTHLRELGIEAIVAPIGDNSARVRILNSARDHGLATPQFIHGGAVVPPETHIGLGSYILPGTIVMPFVDIGDSVMVSMGVRIAHHVRLETGSFLSAGVNMGAGVRVSRLAFVGIGATVMTGVKELGASSVVGAGAVVIRDVREGATVVGNPAREIVREDSVGS